MSDSAIAREVFDSILGYHNFFAVVIEGSDGDIDIEGIYFLGSSEDITIDAYDYSSMIVEVKRAFRK